MTCKLSWHIWRKYAFFPKNAMQMPKCVRAKIYKKRMAENEKNIEVLDIFAFIFDISGINLVTYLNFIPKYAVL